MTDESKLRARLSEFADRLEVLGFFRYALPEVVASLKRVRPVNGCPIRSWPYAAVDQ